MASLGSPFLYGDTLYVPGGLGRFLYFGASRIRRRLFYLIALPGQALEEHA